MEARLLEGFFAFYRKPGIFPFSSNVITPKRECFMAGDLQVLQ